MHFFLCKKRRTIGHYRSLWYIDETENSLEDDYSTPDFYEPDEIIQAQVVVAQHGELPEGHTSVMRLGRGCIVYAPLTN